MLPPLPFEIGFDSTEISWFEFPVMDFQNVCGQQEQSNLGHKLVIILQNPHFNSLIPETLILRRPVVFSRIISQSF